MCTEKVKYKVKQGAGTRKLMDFISGLNKKTFEGFLT